MSEGRDEAGDRFLVIGLASVLSLLCFGALAKMLFLHTHPPGENPWEHEWDPLTWALLLGLGGLFASMALSTWRRWAEWVSAVVCLLAPFATIGAFVALAWAADALGLSR
jgi:hypothetical protein